MTAQVLAYTPQNPIRVVTATALFDGHDAAINIYRRMLQSAGVEVIHLGHNRSVRDIVDAAVQEDVQGVAVSSYQGGHVEFFKYLVDLLRESGAPHVRVFGGGGGVIVPEEVQDLEAYGVTKIYTPEDGARMGLQGIVEHMVRTLDFSRVDQSPVDLSRLVPDNVPLVANLITTIAENGSNGRWERLRADLRAKAADRIVPVVGITGTGGSGKSSLTDELIQRLMLDQPAMRVAIFSADPSRRKTGGALLGDRIRMNAIGDERVFMRSLATRQSASEIPAGLDDVVLVAKAAGFDLIIVETAGIGQGDSSIVAQVDLSIYVMTSDFGAASQLEKIDMLDFADLVVVNKFEKRGGEDAVRDVRKQVQRNRTAFDLASEQMPVFGTIAAKFNDDGVTALYQSLLETIAAKTGVRFVSGLPQPPGRTSSSQTIIIPPERTRYLAEIAQAVRKYHAHTDRQAEALRRVWHLEQAAQTVDRGASAGDREALLAQLRKEAELARQAVDPASERLLGQWEEIRRAYSQDQLVYTVRDEEIRTPLHAESLSHQKIPKIALPALDEPGAL
ncbi:MAG: cobalamin-dependent protein, partial [Desulfatitalea sp.]